MPRFNSDRELMESFYAELDLVFRRHNDAIVREPEMATALLINMADTLRDKFNLETSVEEVGDGLWVVYVGEDEAGGLLGFERDQDTGELAGTDLPDDMEVGETRDPAGAFGGQA